MNSGLIGYTGLIGSNIFHKKNFSKLYNSKNILEIKNENFDLLIFADLSAKKYLVNKAPSEDRKNLDLFFRIFDHINIKKFVFISTIDVYPNLLNVNEETYINEKQLDYYGLHRFKFEKYVTEHFHDHHIIRLPMLFGKGLKKNVLFDLMQGQFLTKINPGSTYQWYYLNNLWRDIECAINNNIRLINMVSEPIKLSNIIKKFFPRLNIQEMEDNNDTKEICMDIKTTHNYYYSNINGYIYNKKYILDKLKNFLDKY